MTGRRSYIIPRNLSTCQLCLISLLALRSGQKLIFGGIPSKWRGWERWFHHVLLPQSPTMPLRELHEVAMSMSRCLPVSAFGVSVI